MTGREGGDGGEYDRIGGGRKSSIANVLPQIVIGAQGEKLRCGTAGGGECGTVELVEDVRFDYVRVDGGDDWIRTAVIRRGCGGD